MRSVLSRQFANNLHCKPGLVVTSRFAQPCRLLWKPKYITPTVQDVQTSRHSSTKTASEQFQDSHRTISSPVTTASSDSYADSLARQPFTAFNLNGRVYIVTGAAGGIGLSMAEALAEAGGEVHCLDRSDVPSTAYCESAGRLEAKPEAGMLHYKQADVTDTKRLNEIVEAISMRKQRLDGLIAAAGIVQVKAALEYNMEEAQKLMDVNFNGVLATANACAKQMIRHKTHGSICLIASMSGLIANKGLLSPVYNSSKAAVIQLARNLAMEWSKVQADGSGGIRVNTISPGHVVTPMVLKTFKEAPGVKEKWEKENLMGRLGNASEFKGAALFVLSEASSFMTGTNLVIDGGHTAW